MNMPPMKNSNQIKIPAIVDRIRVNTEFTRDDLADSFMEIGINFGGQAIRSRMVDFEKRGLITRTWRSPAKYILQCTQVEPLLMYGIEVEAYRLKGLCDRAVANRERESAMRSSWKCRMVGKPGTTIYKYSI
jgi:hypothetical protein